MLEQQRRQQSKESSSYNSLHKEIMEFQKCKPPTSLLHHTVIFGRNATANIASKECDEFLPTANNGSHCVVAAVAGAAAATEAHSDEGDHRWHQKNKPKLPAVLKLRWPALTPLFLYLNIKEMQSITQTELQEEIQRHRRLQDRQQIAPQMQYVGTQNLKPGPSHKPTVHEQAYQQKYVT